eukprot:CAMPEP_0167794254 /NCGR_PEP_ID=MMETSP0111_2-20121227/13697_1 /TAXON_ID=91324 /ORGANISM="Lotharella globosa, Strain CCCM811" /LENGTH=114 /DNA_ID=CAMNT_0007687629 /DNA_START=429 /DNA_END=773 /DNA_ORIENTATION=+
MTSFGDFGRSTVGSSFFLVLFLPRRPKPSPATEFVPSSSDLIRNSGLLIELLLHRWVSAPQRGTAWIRTGGESPGAIAVLLALAGASELASGWRATIAIMHRTTTAPAAHVTKP